MAHIENWTLRNPFMRMTVNFKKGIDFLHGDATGHLILGAGPVFTSPLVEFDPIAKTATTLSGTDYTLGDMSAQYAEFVEEHK